MGFKYISERIDEGMINEEGVFIATRDHREKVVRLGGRRLRFQSDADLSDDGRVVYWLTHRVPLAWDDGTPVSDAEFEEVKRYVREASVLFSHLPVVVNFEGSERPV